MNGEDRSATPLPPERLNQGGALSFTLIDDFTLLPGLMRILTSYRLTRCQCSDVVATTEVFSDIFRSTFVGIFTLSGSVVFFDLIRTIRLNQVHSFVVCCRRPFNGSFPRGVQIWSKSVRSFNPNIWIFCIYLLLLGSC